MPPDLQTIPPTGTVSILEQEQSVPSLSMGAARARSTFGWQAESSLLYDLLLESNTEPPERYSTPQKHVTSKAQLGTLCNCTPSKNPTPSNRTTMISLSLNPKWSLLDLSLTTTKPTMSPASECYTSPNVLPT